MSLLPKGLIEPVYDKEDNHSHLCGSAVVFHCHHYNLFLQRTIEETPEIPAMRILVDSAAEEAYAQISCVLQRQGDTLSDPLVRLALIEEACRVTGYGLLDFSGVSEEGGVVKCPMSHYAFGWRKKWGLRKTPCCFFLTGYIAGGLDAVFNQPMGTYKVREEACYASGSEQCRFVVKKG